MSTLDTPPPNRQSVTTSIVSYDERLIRSAIQRELSRGGQVFFLHNRVHSIESMRDRLADLVPEARILIGHGQMDKTELEKVMETFVAGRADILLATTIIESGIDIPNANTIIIDRADRFGLADLYQLRGRVGRSDRRAYALLLLPREALTTGDAKKRLSAIRQYTDLGSGFKIAMRDLEIRGAGSLLGTKQSGHIAAVGFDLYCQLLRQSIDQIKGKAPATNYHPTLKLDFVSLSEPSDEEAGQLPAYIPLDYAPHGELRVTAYRQLASLQRESELNSLIKDWRDRFGPAPEPVTNLHELTRLRLLAAHRRIESLEVKNDRLLIQRNRALLLPADGKFPRLSKGSPLQKLTETIRLVRSM